MKLLTSFFVFVLLFAVSCTSSSNKETSLNDITVPQATSKTSPAYSEAVNKKEDTPLSQFYITAGSGLSLREASNLNSKKILTIPYGGEVSLLSTPEHTSMTVDGITGNMVEVSYQGAKGFVFSGYLSTLSPPLDSETVQEYAKRLSTPERPITVSKIKNAKGDEFGLITSIELPAKSWGEAFSIARSLFDVPKGIQVDLTNTTKSLVINKNKRDKTKTDEVTVTRNDQNLLQKITYSYVMRGYTRTVTITKKDALFSISEVEVSQ